MKPDINEELALINRYARKELTLDDIYVFSLTLCDNEIDRDFERFTPKALGELAVLFEGKTGLFDHSCKSEQQSARLFKTWVETDKTRITACGEPYTMLKARAYMVRTKQNQSLIDEIEGGIKKEVSVGCAMGQSLCSICGADRRKEGCEHVRGRKYHDVLCHDVLEGAADAYEWSFVAVPAQREAGVTKSFLKEESPTEPILETIKSAEGELTLSKKQLNQLKAQLAALEQSQQDAAAYRKKLMADIARYAAIAMPKLDIKLFLEGCANMQASALQSLGDSLKAQSEAGLPPQPQLKSAARSVDGDNHAFCI